MNEKAIVFACRGADLVGVTHDPGSGRRRGVIIVVGGPQYRAGSHRQYVLLARSLAAAGIPVLRFDYRGLGDSDGAYLGFEHLADDIAAAIDVFMAEVAGLTEVVLWGLCDAASAILFYAPRDKRVSGVVLLNPWLRTDETLARTYLKHYYTRRLFEQAFWTKVVKGSIDPLQVGRSFVRVVATALAPRTQQPATPLASASPATTTLMPVAAADARPLPDRMAEALQRYGGRILLIMSGNDLTAREFDEISQGSRRWRRLLAERGITRLDLKDCDHTFSRREWREAVAAATLDQVLRH